MPGREAVEYRHQAAEQKDIKNLPAVKAGRLFF